MAFPAVFALAALMGVVTLVAIKTLRRGLGLVQRGLVAVRAARFFMFTLQSKLGIFVVTKGCLIPAFWGVAFLAGGAVAATMAIVEAVAGMAGLIQFLFAGVLFMARLAF